MSAMLGDARANSMADFWPGFREGVCHSIGDLEFGSEVEFEVVGGEAES